ncbi:hypothetical protein [Priestia megaterium]|uniref:hypothetical protein n=1 Tax=Priestia megaterium TaxID=1404 RepID=UPI0015D49CE0|nr:hypothetical protein [Priestia megaterium]
METPLKYQLLEDDFKHVYKSHEQLLKENKELREENERLQKLHALIFENQKII